MSSSTAGDIAEPSLPLDWTRLSRKRSVGEQDCCDDPATCRRRRRFVPTRGKLVAETDSLPSASQNLVKGIALFCLHEMNPDWFQGYFFPHNDSSCLPDSLAPKTKPWGLLAVQEEVDDCLVCQDGGYRRLTLKVYRPGVDRNKAVEFKGVDWTGGDMIILGHDRLSMETEQFIGGKSSLSYIQRYFQGLVDRLRAQCEVNEEQAVVEWLPDIAVVKGEMTMAISEKDGIDIETET